MTWQIFPWIVGGAGALWLGGFTIGRHRPWPWVLAGTLLIVAFIAGLWLHLERPPLRTLGETRLWFGALLPIGGLFIYALVRWRWPLAYACAIAALFLAFTAMRPATHDRTLMPALQSPYFVPHVVLYLLAYAFLAYTAALAAWAWWQGRAGTPAAKQNTVRTLGLAEVGLWLGFGFLTLGLLVGAVWAKEAWGHYWTWDPKETWSFLTWAVYLAYLHLRPEWQAQPRHAAAYLALASTVVLICWFGVNYLPSAQQSVHTYTG